MHCSMLFCLSEFPLGNHMLFRWGFSFVCDLCYFSCNFEEFFLYFVYLGFLTCCVVFPFWSCLGGILCACVCQYVFPLFREIFSDLVKAIVLGFFSLSDYCSFDGVSHFLYDPFLCFQYFSLSLFIFFGTFTLSSSPDTLTSV